MKKKQLTFFTKKQSSFWFFATPLITLVVVSIGLLIATGWYSVDYRIAEEIAKGVNTEFGKYLTRFYDTGGNTELVPVIMIYLSIIFETVFLTKIAQNQQKNNLWKKNYWIVDGYYIVVIIGWIAYYAHHITFMILTPSPFGKGIDFILLESIKYRITGGFIAFTYQSIILGLGLYYVRYHLVKTNRILKEQYWLKSIKVFSFFICSYIVIVTIKGTTNRFYYYNAIFGDLFDKLPQDIKDNYLESGIRRGYNPDMAASGIVGDGWIKNIPPELQYPWWKSSLPLRSNPAMPYYPLPSNLAFPSGHMNSMFGSGSLFLLVLKNKDNGKVSWKVKACFGVWLTHLLTMKFALIMERMHWISDTACTLIISILMIVIIHFTVNKIFAKKIN